jgi:hypothetical protein
VRDREHPPKVDAEHEVPQLLVGVDEIREPIGAGVVDEHVDLAERLDGGCDSRAHRVRVRDVKRAREPVQLPRDRASPLLVEIADRHARALRG